MSGIRDEGGALEANIIHSKVITERLSYVRRNVVNLTYVTCISPCLAAHGCEWIHLNSNNSSKSCFLLSQWTTENLFFFTFFPNELLLPVPSYKLTSQRPNGAAKSQELARISPCFSTLIVPKRSFLKLETSQEPLGICMKLSHLIHKTLQRTFWVFIKC